MAGPAPGGRSAVADGAAAAPRPVGWPQRLWPAGIRWQLTVTYALVALAGVGMFTVLLLAWGLLGADARGRSGTEVSWLVLAAAALSTWGAAVLGYRYAGVLRRRLNNLWRGIAALATGNLSYRQPVEGDDEFAQLAEQFNAMARRMEDSVVSLQRLAAERAALAERAHDTATLEERQRLARELHDSVNQQIFAINMQAAAARRRLPPGADAAAAELSRVEELASAALAELRNLILELRPVSLEGRDLATALGEFITGFQERTGLSIDYKAEGGADLPAVEDALFRIAQEALANVAKHSEACRAAVRLNLQPPVAVLEVVDNGKGFTGTPRLESVGIRSMQSRAKELGGEVAVQSGHCCGTRVVARIPLSRRKID